MGVSALFAFNGSAAAEKYSSDSLWSVGYSSAESMKIIDLTGDGVNDLFIQNGNSASIYDAAGNLVASADVGNGKSTMGDLNGDGVEDVILFQIYPPMVQMIDKGRTITLLDATSNIGMPARVAIIKFEGQTEIVLGADDGWLLGLSSSGQELWQARMGSEELRGMDDARVNGKIHLAVGSHSGDFGIVDGSGDILWANQTEQLRRIRSYDLFGDGTSEILTGGEYGEFAIWNGAEGTRSFIEEMGQAISEIRTAEINGDPSSIEIIVGGKDGGLWALDAHGKEIWSRSVSDKVTEIVGVDFDDDGRQEVIVGDDAGEVIIFSPDGARSKLGSYSSGITRIDEGRLGNERVLAVSDADQLEVRNVTHNKIPGFQFAPILVGLIVSAAIIAVAWILATMPKRPEMKVSIQDKSRESLEAERRMIKESIADVERLRKAGEVTGDAYLARLKRLRADLAENETAFKEQKFPITVETIKCPNCGGMLELGMDKCEYCGHVILT
ncbi:MAG: hypothetical protein HFACDABA_00158 [Anaerolineales bacterium]|nr:hypothetical protein [Anaerolineales bacterium]